MKIRANLISAQIKQFQKCTGMSDATFGRYAMNDTNFARRAHEARDDQMVSLATAHRCGEYMLRVLEASNVPEAVKFRETLAEWLARNPVTAATVKATPAIRHAPTVITHAIPAAIADMLKPAEKFILQKYIDAVVCEIVCPSYIELAAAYQRGKSQAWANPSIARLKQLGLIKIEGGSTPQRRVTLLFPPFMGMSTKCASDNPKPVKPFEEPAPVKRVVQSEPCFKCGCARGCECGAPALIHTRSGGHLPNLLRSAAR